VTSNDHRDNDYPDPTSEPALDAEPNPYAPPKSLAEEPAPRPAVDEPPTSEVYLRPLARRQAAIAFNVAEGAIVIGTFAVGVASSVASESLLTTLTILRIVISVAGFIVFLTWFYRKYKNLYVLGRDQMRFTPGWAVGYWFVPFLNLVRPVQCVYDIWNGGALDEEPMTGNLLFGVWWAAWIVSGVIAQISGGIDDPTLYLVSYALDLFLIGLTISVIRTLAARQERKARAMGLLK
jgi:hypothetical protein